MRLEEARDAIVRLVVDEDGAEQGLLGLDVVGGAAERHGISRTWKRRGLGGLAAGGFGHMRRHSRFRSPGDDSGAVNATHPRYAHTPR